LDDLGDPNDPDETDRDKLEKNLECIEHWLIDSISSNAVPKEMADIFEQAADHPAAGFCAFLAHQLKHYNHKLSSDDKLPIFDEADLSVKNILNAIKPDKTVCLGDILFLLDKIMEKHSDEGYRHFPAAIKMLFSLRLTKYLKGHKDEGDIRYKNAKDLLGLLVVHPNVRLTAATGSEWNPQNELSSLRVRKHENDNDNGGYFIGGHKYEIKNEIKTEKKISAAISVEHILWMSMFMVTPYRIIGKDYHKPFANEWSEKLPWYRGEQGVVSISLHWMRFITAVLDPDDAIDRLTWRVNWLHKGDSEIELYIDNLKKNRTPLPIHSIDVIHALTEEMYNNRQEQHKIDKDDAKSFESVQFQIFMINLVKSLGKVLEKSILDEIDIARCLKKLKDHPLVNDADTDRHFIALTDFDVFRTQSVPK
jgi:hypothetical protein